MKFGNHLLALGLALGLALLLAACGSAEQRAAEYVVNAQKHYDAGDYVKARLEAQNAAQVAPRNARARYLLALVAEHQQDYKAMFGHLLVAVSSDPANVEARLKIGTLYFLGQAWAQAAEQATELLKLAPKDARVHLLQARVLIQQGDDAAGRAELATALKLDPDYTDAILLQAAADATENPDTGLLTLDTAIARLDAEKARPLRELRIIMLAQGKKTGELEQGLRALSEDFPYEPAYQFKLAQFYVSQGRADEADKLLKGLTELDPKATDKQLGYVRFLASQKDDARTEAAFKTFIEQNPDAGPLRLALGEFLEARERPFDARPAYQALAERSPKSPEGLKARNRLAALEIRAGKPEEGRVLIEKILADAPDDAQALLLRAGLRFQDKKFGDSIADLRIVVREEPANEKALLLLAHDYFETGDIVLAKDTYRRLLEVIPNSADGLRQLAVLHFMNKEYPEAEALLRQQLKIQPDDLQTSSRLVEVLLDHGQSDQAEVEARRLAALASQAGLGDFSLGRVLATKNDFAGAAEAFRKSVSVRKDDPLPLEGLVRSLLAAGKPNEAIAVLNEQVAKGQQPLFAKFLLGGVYARQGNPAGAARYLEGILKAKPDSVVAWASLAGLYPKDGEARIRVYQRALQANPGNTEISMVLGSEFEQAGHFDQAIALYDQLLKATPGYAPAINNLAALLLEPGDDKARVARALALAKGLEKTDNPAMLDTLGWAHYRAGEYPEAVRVLERVVAKAGQIPVFRYHLGMAYLAAGNPVGARQQLQQAVENIGEEYPGLEEAQLTLRKMERAPRLGS